jgi:uncharacterized membrane protein
LEEALTPFPPKVVSMSIDVLFSAGLAILGLTALALTFLISRKTKTEPNYRALFRLGIIFLVAGTGGEILSFLYGGNGLDSFFVLGIIYVAVGLVKRETWKKSI